jgi:hypothetical protein
MTNTVLIKRSGVANSVPAAGNLSLGELAINYADGNLFYKNSGGTVTVIASNKFVSVTGNINGANIVGTTLSATGNVVANNVIATTIVSAASFTGTLASVSGNVTANNVIATTIVSAASFTGTVVSVTGNITAAGATFGAGNVSTTGNISAGYFIGNGSALTGITSGTLTSTVNNFTGNGGSAFGLTVTPSTANLTFINIDGVEQIRSTYTLAGNVVTFSSAPASGANIEITTLSGQVVASPSSISSGSSNATIGASSGNVTVGVNGTSNVAVFATTGEYVTGVVSATGNITGNYFLGNGACLSGIITSVANINNGTSNVTVVSSGGNITVGVGGTSNVAVFATTGEYVTGVVSVSGNVTGGNLITGALVQGATVSSSGNVVTVGVAASGNISATANVQGGNGVFTTIVSAASHTGTIVSVTGNVNGGNLISAALVQGATLSSSGNVVTVGVAASGNISATANVQGGNLATAGSVAVGAATAAYRLVVTGAANTIAAQVLPQGALPDNNDNAGLYVLHQGTAGTAFRARTDNALTGSIFAHVLVNNTSASINGFQVSQYGTGYIADFNKSGTALNSVRIDNNGNVGIGTTSVSYRLTLKQSTGDLQLAMQGTAKNWNFRNQSDGTFGYFDDSLGYWRYYYDTSNNHIWFNATNTERMRIDSAGNLSVVGSIVVNSSSNGTAIVNGAANAVGNIGSSTTYFNRLFAQATTALYADLAEMYTTDAEYTPGTVLVFGGNQEVTISTASHDDRVAGVVSTNPAHIMNAGLTANHAVAVALSGRVPVSVVGNIAKGDKIVTSDIPGVARSLDRSQYEPGVVIGKAVENYNSTEIGVIEVVVGRL